MTRRGDDLGGRQHRPEVTREEDDAGDAPDVESEWRVPGRRTLLEARREPVDRRAASVGKRSLTAEVARWIERARREGGASLPAQSRARMEAIYGVNLADVRVHTGAEAAEAARSLAADAFTVGRDIFFGAGRFDPATADGLRLLAHEVAHTAQARGTAPGRVSEPGDPHEREAERLAGDVVAGERSEATTHLSSPASAASTGGEAEISRSPVGATSGAGAASSVDVVKDDGSISQVPAATFARNFIDNNIIKVTFYESPLITSGDPKMKALEWFWVHYADGRMLTFKLGAHGVPVRAGRATTAGMTDGSVRIVVDATLRGGRQDRVYRERGGFYWPVDMNESTVPELTDIATTIRWRHMLLAEMFQLQEALGAFANLVGASGGMLGSNPVNEGGFEASYRRPSPRRTTLGRGALRSRPSPEGAARQKLQQMEAAEDGHSLGRHGPDISDEALRRRVTDGVAPDGGISPTPASTRFSDHQTMLKTRQAADDYIKQELHLDLDGGTTPPGPGREAAVSFVIEHGRPIDDGFVGSRPVKRPHPKDPKKTINVYEETSQVSGITRTKTTVRWNPKTRRWRIVQHFPVQDGWDNAAQRYTKGRVDYFNKVGMGEGGAP